MGLLKYLNAFLLMTATYDLPYQTRLRPVPKYNKDKKGNDWLLIESANYSIGELIEMLPDFINIWDLTDFNANKKIWNVGYAFSPTISRPELIDALYDMVVKLKEES